MQVFFTVVYHFFPETSYPFPNRGELLTQGEELPQQLRSGLRAPPAPAGSSREARSPHGARYGVAATNRAIRSRVAVSRVVGASGGAAP